MPPPTPQERQEAIEILAQMHIIEAALDHEQRDSAEHYASLYLNYMADLYATDVESIERRVKTWQADDKFLQDIYPDILKHIDSLKNDRK